MRTRVISLTAAVIGAVLLCVGPWAGSARAVCGDFNIDGGVTATDALGVLRVAVGSEACPLVRCDVDNNGRVTGTDALAVLKNAVGQSVVMACPGAAVNSIADLPKATGPVVDESSGSAFVAGLPAATAQTTSLVLGSLSNQSFDSNSSMAACEIANMTRIAVESAAEADLVLCYVQNIIDNNQNVGIDLYDGQYHTFALDFGTPAGGGTQPPGPEETGPSKVKMKIVRDGSTITEFEMFACTDGPSGPVQQEYTHQIIDGGDFSMTAKGMFSDPFGGTNAHQVQVSGHLDDVGQFVGKKDINLAHQSDWGNGGTGYGEMFVEQQPALLDLNGYDAGSWTFEESPGVQKTNNYSHRVTAEAELFDLNQAGAVYEIGKLALGDGAAKVNMRDGDDFKWWDFTEIQGWDGETTQLDNVNPTTFIDKVRANDLPVVADSVTIEFGPSETWDCSDPPEVTVSVDQLAIDAACSALQLGHEWIDCRAAIEGAGPGGPGGGGPGGGCDPATDPNCCDPATDPNCGPQCDPATDPNCCDPATDPNCPDGYCDPSNPSDPDCGGCDPAVDPNCPAAPPCDPAVDQYCFPHPIDACWDPACTCSPDDPACVDQCFDTTCDSCWDSTCTCSPGDPGCVDACWDTTCGVPCLAEGCQW